jgi:hypothetical protein
VLAERHERKPVIITSNMGLVDWTQVFGDANLTAVLLDRPTHKPIISCKWESVLEYIGSFDPAFLMSLYDFYRNCLVFNRSINIRSKGKLPGKRTKIIRNR